MTTVPLKSTGGSTVKFLCCYGGKILPRRSDGWLRYVGGHSRILSVDRAVSFSELMVKLGELCGCSVTLRCQLPCEELDVLVSIKSDEDLANVIEEYDRANSLSMSARERKIRAVLSPPKSLKYVSPPLSSSASSSLHSSPTKSIITAYRRSNSAVALKSMSVADSSLIRSMHLDHHRSSLSFAPKSMFYQISVPSVGSTACANKPHFSPFLLKGYSIASVILRVDRQGDCVISKKKKRDVWILTEIFCYSSPRSAIFCVLK
ncbi:hypothetical protein Nepgr_018608 [Nepenthes gracilis]|uniref:PB1 domain-containing protein n=1 Tax=Nepenthes gracilis TaxID=150966 RepID=A0AAD3XT75_NEPGR|nr:hypothetical protein Nepgr_018608 [Nepenthes gracilis]